jgi:hypothetical protein
MHIFVIFITNSQNSPKSPLIPQRPTKKVGNLVENKRLKFGHYLGLANEISAYPIQGAWMG